MNRRIRELLTIQGDKYKNVSIKDIGFAYEEKMESRYLHVKAIMEDEDVYMGMLLIKVERLRKLLFKRVAGHGEHHPTQSCGICKKLRLELGESNRGY